MLRHLFHFRGSKPDAPPAAPPTPAEPAPPPPPPPAPPAAQPLVPKLGSSPMAAMAAGGIAISKSLPDAARASAAAAVPPDVARRAADISLYKNLLSSLYYGILICDAKGTIIGSNQRAEQYFGFSSQDLWGLPCEELVVGMNARMLFKLRANADAGRFTVVNGNCKRKDGTTFPAEIAISRGHLFNDGDFIFSIHNVERREKVREQRDLSEDAIRWAGAAVAVCAQDGRIDFVNAAFLKLVGLDSAELVLKRMLGDFCDSIDALDAMLHAPSPQGAWMGTVGIKNAKGFLCETLAASALSLSRHGAEQRLVITLLPLPKKIG